MARHTYMTREDLLYFIRTNRADFAALWEDLTVEEMERRPGPFPERSIKDMIAHVVWWENMMLAAVSHRVDGTPAPDLSDCAGINDRVFEENKNRPLIDVLMDFEKNLEVMIERLESLTTHELNDTSEGVTLLQYFTSNTVDHYAEHGYAIQRYVKQLR
jgi:hypothetical protein